MNLKLKVDRYYELLPRVEEAVKNDDFELALRYAGEGISLIPDLIAETVERYGRFDIVESSIVEYGSLLLAMSGDIIALQALHATLLSAAARNPLTKTVHRWVNAVPLINEIRSRVQASPGVLQLSLRDEFPPQARKLFIEVCYWLERTGEISRERAGKSYALYPPEEVGFPPGT